MRLFLVLLGVGDLRGVRSQVLASPVASSCQAFIFGDCFPCAEPNFNQPRKLQCWPRSKVPNSPNVTSVMGCTEVKILEDTAKFWPGQCLDLTRRWNLSTSCETDCVQNPFCQSWQLGKDGSCWQGLGKKCYARSMYAASTTVQAQRLQHGNVKVLLDLKGWDIDGLTQAFDVKGDGYFQSDAEAITACRMTCYSDIQCDFWLYSSWTGCWVEDVRSRSVQYPLTLFAARKDSRFAQSCLAGEYIQHSCAKEDAVEPMLASPPIPSCASRGYSFDALSDITDVESRGGTRVVSASNPFQCQMYCFKMPKCAFFSFRPVDGQCQFHDAAAVMIQEAAVVSGPRTCPQKQVQNMTVSVIVPKSHTAQEDRIVFLEHWPLLLVGLIVFACSGCILGYILLTAFDCHYQAEKAKDVPSPARRRKGYENLVPAISVRDATLTTGDRCPAPVSATSLNSTRMPRTLPLLKEPFRGQP